jgi:Protein of unknown function (DUF2721)
MTIGDLIPVLQLAVGPVILISGVGLLLLSMTNRLGRTIDRCRILLDARKSAADNERGRHDSQLNILWRRAQLLRTAITLAAISVLLAAALVIVLFIAALAKLEIAIVVIALFVGCMAAVIAALVYFIRDIDLALHALALELELPPSD